MIPIYDFLRMILTLELSLMMMVMLVLPPMVVHDPTALEYSLDHDEEDHCTDKH